MNEPKTVIADVRESGLESCQFDCVFNIGLLEHFEDPIPVIKESLRLLKTGGLLFSVIVPPTPRSRQWPIQMALNPLMSSIRIARHLASRLLKGERKKSKDQMVRTDFTRQKWIDWTESLGGLEVQCVPYNCYHEVYKSRFLETKITVPVYRWYHERKRRNGPPSFATSSWLACADLLICHKQ